MKLQSAKPIGQAESAKSSGLSKSEGRTVVLKTPEKPNVHGNNLDSASKLKNPDSVRPAQSSPIKKPELVPEFPSGKTISAKELFIKTAANLGFPKDALSVALLAFARYFSVSLSPALIGALRREILASGKSSSPETPAEKAALEADALSALIADDKGVELSPQTLEHYAGFLSFPEENIIQPDEADYSPKRDHSREECPEAEEMQILIEEQAQNDETLTFLNNLPGKNGQRWLVFPFSVRVKGIEFQIFLRLLIKESVSSIKGESSEEEHLIVDISGPKRQWRCFLKKAGEKFLADIRVYPGQTDRALKSLQKEAEQILKEGRALFGSFKGFDEIIVQNGEEAPSWADALCGESLPSIDEQV
jgi:hypothetical protein